MSHSRAGKREQFSRKQQKKNNPKLVIGAVAAVLVAIVIFLVFGQSNTAAAVTKVSATPSAAEVRIPIADVSGGQAKFFEYTAANHKRVRFFVIKSSDGVYRAAADACEVCFREKKGYHQRGDDMVCKKCGRHFPSTSVNEVTGGCNPSGIPQRVEGSTMVIAAADLDAHAVLF